MANNDDRIHILDLTLDELARRCEEAGLERYRAKQIFDWIFHKPCTDFQAMTNLSKSLRERLAEQYVILTGKEIDRKVSRDGTEKLLLEFQAGKQVESVLIPSPTGLTACLSTQFGCPVGCAFCASGRGDFAGNLTTGQIIEQLLQLEIIADDFQSRISHVVFMGMGEPLLNYDNTVKALRTINSDWSFHIAARHITVSTVGLPEQMRRLAHEGLQITLAISLHSADQAVREQLIPIAHAHTIDQIIEATQYYFQHTGREVTLEYVVLRDINTSLEDAGKLAQLAKRLRANVNLIVYNPTDGSSFEAPTKRSVDTFVEQLRRQKVNVHLRASKGRDIQAACGQLKERYREHDPTNRPSSG